MYIVDIRLCAAMNKSQPAGELDQVTGKMLVVVRVYIAEILDLYKYRCLFCKKLQKMEFIL